MLDKLRKQVTAELTHLDQLMSGYTEVLDEVKSRNPTLIELAALAALLHSFYTGVENIFKRIAIEADAFVPTGDSWHHDLLDQMTQGRGRRPPVISPRLRERLAHYMAFRHVFRSSFLVDLLWEKMQPLVLDLRSVFQAFRGEIKSFLCAGE